MTSSVKPKGSINLKTENTQLCQMRMACPTMVPTSVPMGSIFPTTDPASLPASCSVPVAATTHWHLTGYQQQVLKGASRPGLPDRRRGLNPGKPRAWLAFRKFRAVYSSCAVSTTTNSLPEWQQLYWQANSIKARASNKVSGSSLCIKNMESCLRFPECPQP